MSEELPPDVRERVVATGRRVAEGSVPEETLETLLAPHGYRPRIREDDGERVLVCYPEEWAAEGAVQPDRIDAIDRAIELPLSGSGDRDWDAVAAENRAVVATVAREHGDPHEPNVRAFARFMNDHRARPIAQATDADVEEFLSEYYPRNVWPSDDEAAVVGTSVTIARRVAREQL